MQMALIRVARIFQAKQYLLRRYSCSDAIAGVPKGYFAVYVGDGEQEKKRFVIPVAYLNQPSFQDLLSQSQEQFGSDHPILGALTIPCSLHIFLDLTSRFIDKNKSSSSFHSSSL